MSSLVAILVFGALPGAKIPVILSYGLTEEMLWTGKSYFGALIGAFLAINIYKFFWKIEGHFGDRFVVPLCVSSGIGKIGCYIHGCCAGSATDFLFRIKNVSGIDVHPVQLYESFFEFFCAALFFLLYRLNLLKGSHFLIYMLLYMTARFGFEFIRTEPRLLFGLSIYQLMSILFAPIFSLMLYYRVRNDPSTR